MSIVLKGGTLIDGTGASPLQQAVVVLDGGRIGKIGKGSRGGQLPPPRVEVAPGQRRRDTRARTRPGSRTRQ